MHTASSMFAYSSNLSGMFEHLHKKREQDAELGSMFEEQNTGRGVGRDVDLDIIQEQSVDYSSHVAVGINDSSEILNVNDDDEFINKPTAFNSRRQTMMTDLTTKTTEKFYDQDESCDDYGEPVYAPWVDRVKLRHGMDWLDLITNEVDRDTARNTSTINNLRNVAP